MVRKAVKKVSSRRAAATTLKKFGGYYTPLNSRKTKSENIEVPVTSSVVPVTSRAPQGPSSLAPWGWAFGLSPSELRTNRHPANYLPSLA
jgi:hypothetical protein